MHRHKQLKGGPFVIRFLIAASMLLFASASASAQSMDDLNLQIHGYATQGFLYTTNNNILTTSSSDGSPAWTETVVNVSAQPTPKLRVTVQARYFLLGNFGNTITLDYALADYKISDRFGLRFGKVKTPSGLFNEIQDIDPSYMWSLLPQSIYPIASRNSLLSHYGGAVYGTLPLSSKLGKLEYRGWGGERSIGTDDGYLLSERELGIVLPNGLDAVAYGAALHWKTPLPGFMIGASLNHENASSNVIVDTIPGYGAFNGAFQLKSLDIPNYFASYEKQKLMLAGEFTRLPVNATIQVPGVFAQSQKIDYRGWYGMASYKLTDKLSVGMYDSQFFDHQAVLGPARYSKDWAISGRYDFNQFLYAKAEQHFINGTALSYDTDLNPGIIKPVTKLTILKIGVSF
jgi:hypothetical protein